MSNSQIVLQFGNTVLDVPGGRLIAKETVTIQRAKIRLLSRLVLSPRYRFGKQQLYELLYGDRDGRKPGPKILDVYVSIIRHKLRIIGSDSKIETSPSGAISLIPGSGERFVRLRFTPHQMRAFERLLSEAQHWAPKLAEIVSHAVPDERRQ